MKTPDLLELATRNLREALLRNALTTLGIAVGIASLVAMLSLGIGLQSMATQRLAKSGLFDTIVVTSRRDFRSFNRSEEKTGPAPAQSRALDENTRVEIEKLPNVKEATPDIRFITEIRYADKPHLTLVSTLPPSAAGKDAFDSMEGKFFSSPAAPEAILQKEVALELLGLPEDSKDTINSAALKSLIGKELTMKYAERQAVSFAPAEPPKVKSGAPIPAASGQFGDFGESSSSASFSVLSRETKLRISGITDQDPEGMKGGGRGRIFLPLKFAQDLHVMVPSDLRENTRSFSSQPTYLTLTVTVSNPSRVQDVQEAIRKMGFNTFSILDATRSLRRFFSILDLFLGIFGSLALAVASIGIVNTLVMAILERRREIGIMKALGASDIDVKKLFFAEAGAMGFLGGALGVSLGWFLGRVINAGTNVFLKHQDLPPENVWIVPLWLVGGAIAFSVVLSLLAGIYPASRAAKLDPVQALRYE